LRYLSHYFIFAGTVKPGKFMIDIETRQSMVDNPCTPMTSPLSDKLAAIVAEIDADGRANLTRLTVLKKWFEREGRLAAFGLWIARRAVSRRAPSGRGTVPEAAPLLRQARRQLGSGSPRASL